MLSSGVPGLSLSWASVMQAEPARQAGFAAALLDPEKPVPDGVEGRQGKTDQRRFAVYRNNVAVSLSNALGDIFPVVRELVGDEWFSAMARVFFKDHPPRNPVLAEWGHDLPAFLETFPPAARLPYLADVARMERAWLDAYHAADAAPMKPEALGAIPQDQLADAVFDMHPATRVMALQHAAVTIFAKSKAKESLSGTNPMIPEAALVTRPGDAVMVRHVPLAAVFFFDALAGGATLGEAAGSALSQDPAFDIGAALAASLEAGVFVNCRLAGAQGE